MDIISNDFTNIRVGEFIIYDESDECTTNIADCTIHIISGLIYRAVHRITSHIIISNVSIVTSQVMVTDDDQALLYFNSADLAIIDGLDVLQYYDAEQYCVHNGHESNQMLRAQQTLT